MDYVINYSWPGNARELKNFCESILVLVPGRVLTLEDVRKHLKPELADSLIHMPVPFPVSREQKEKDFLFRALVELKSDILDIKESLEASRHAVRNESAHTDGLHISKEKISKMNLDEIEREVITYLLENNGWNIEHVATQLNQSSRNIYKKMKKYNISKEDRWRR